MIVICGIGYFEEKLIANLKDKEVIAIDIDPNKAKSIEEKFNNVKAIIGDASSILTWKKIELERVNHVITAFKDPDVSLEICFFIRKTFNLEIPILVITYTEGIEEKFSEFGVTIINPLKTAINLVLNKLDKNYSKAIDLGFKKGELIEINVLSKSHLTDRKLKHIKPSNWHLAAIYRNNEIVIPTGNSKIKVGDKIIIFGEPKVLENLTNIFLKGIPQFPLQYGKLMTLYIKGSYELKYLKEALTLFKCSRATTLEIVITKITINDKKIERFIENIEITKEIKKVFSENIFKNLNRQDNGLNAFILPKISFFQKVKLKQIFKETEKPITIFKNNETFSKIVVCLNSPDMAHILEIGIELARLSKVNIETVFTTLPKELRNEDDEKQLNEVTEIVKDFNAIYKMDIKLNILEGNPVRETLRYLNYQKNILLITGYKKFNSGSFFKPSTAYNLAIKCNCSILLIPQSVE